MERRTFLKLIAASAAAPVALKFASLDSPQPAIGVVRELIANDIQHGYIVRYDAIVGGVQYSVDARCESLDKLDEYVREPSLAVLQEYIEGEGHRIADVMAPPIEQAMLEQLGYQARTIELTAGTV